MKCSSEQEYKGMFIYYKQCLNYELCALNFVTKRKYFLTRTTVYILVRKTKIPVQASACIKYKKNP